MYVRPKQRKILDNKGSTQDVTNRTHKELQLHIFITLQICVIVLLYFYAELVKLGLQMLCTLNFSSRNVKLSRRRHVCN
jgi:hypothetical protein